MSRLTHEATERIAAHCQGKLAEIGAALARALDAPIAATAARAETLGAATSPGPWAGPGLLVVLTVETTAALVVLAEKDGFLPPWCAKPDATQQSKLQTLAKELGALLLPSGIVLSEARTTHVGSISLAIGAGELTHPAGCVSLTLMAGARQGPAKIVWPAGRPSAIVSSDPSSWPAKASLDRAVSAQAGATSRNPGESPFPPYLQSLLQIPVPVSVTLVSKRQPMQRILELGPGSILPFDKACTAPLTLEVAGHGIAEGEAVKVGDKFGLRLTSLVMPGERLAAVRKSDEGVRG
jgi:flagellar motor switch/type III secretory pathway protein FliN